jgi:hypothetical protein
MAVLAALACVGVRGAGPSDDATSVLRATYLPLKAYCDKSRVSSRRDASLPFDPPKVVERCADERGRMKLVWRFEHEGQRAEDLEWLDDKALHRTSNLRFAAPYWRSELSELSEGTGLASQFLERIRPLPLFVFFFQPIDSWQMTRLALPLMSPQLEDLFAGFTLDAERSDDRWAVFVREDERFWISRADGTLRRFERVGANGVLHLVEIEAVRLDPQLSPEELSGSIPWPDRQRAEPLQTGLRAELLGAAAGAVFWWLVGRRGRADVDVRRRLLRVARVAGLLAAVAVMAVAVMSTVSLQVAYVVALGLPEVMVIGWPLLAALVAFVLMRWPVAWARTHVREVPRPPG